MGFAQLVNTGWFTWDIGKAAERELKKAA